MAQETATSFSHFQQLRNRQADLRRKNTAGIVDASRRGDRAARDALLRQRVQLNDNDQLILNAEVAFATSGLAQTAAETALISHTRQANRLVKAVSDIGRALTVVSDFADILTDLIGVLR